MPRTAIPITPLLKDGFVQEPTATAVDPTNGHYVDVGGLSGQLVLTVNNTFAGTKVLAVRASSSTRLASRAWLGDAALTLPASARSFVGPLEGSRFVQPQGGTDGGTGGRIFIDLAAGITGSIGAILVPDTV
jgi:hypothetical protein